MKKISKKHSNKILSGTEIEATQLITKFSSNKDYLPELTELAKQLMGLGRFDLATKIYAKWTELEPKSAMAWSNLGASMVRLQFVNEAKTVLMHALSIDPNFKEARINLSGVLQELKDHKEQLVNALETVKLDPKSSIAFNNLGTALNDNGFRAEARHAFETALLLEPNSFFAKFNLAKIASMMEDYPVAIQSLETLLKDSLEKGSADADIIRFNLSEDYLKVGRIKEGWDFYDYGFSRNIPLIISRHPLRKFNVPEWSGQELKAEEKLMIWREQGIGDEIMFGSLLPQVASKSENLIFECSDKLRSIFARSLPEFTVRQQLFDPAKNLSPTSFDYQYHLPIGSLGKFFLNQQQHFTRTSSYLKADPDRVDFFRKRLSIYEERKLIGICWRSGILSVNRNQDYTVLEDWTDILLTPNSTIVNLQYGECEEELLTVEKKLGIEIVRWNDVDLKDDMESVCAIMKNLDLVVSVGTAVAQTAGALGVPTILLARYDWNFLGQRDVYPWFPSVHPLVVDRTDYVAKLLPEVPTMINEMLSSRSL